MEKLSETYVPIIRYFQLDYEIGIIYLFPEKLLLYCENNVNLEI